MKKKSTSSNAILMVSVCVQQKCLGSRIILDTVILFVVEIKLIFYRPSDLK